MKKLIVFGTFFLLLIGCAKTKTPKVQPPPDLTYIKGTCIIGAAVDAKACDVVNLKKVGPALECHDVFIKADQLGCLPAPKSPAH